MGLLGQSGRAVALTIGHSDADEVRRATADRVAQLHLPGVVVESDWHPALRIRLQQYCAGKQIDFGDVKLEVPAKTDFQKRVSALTRRIKYGKTMTYGELAERAGYPRAARAVGTVMSTNPFPILIPCHRVVASGGKPGGYTSPRGVQLKEHLLALEAGS